jgi:3-oxoacyl-[acyl-carrier-protein] synthase-3
MTAAVHVSAFAHALGEPHEVARLEEVLAEGAAEDLAREGLVHYRAASGPAWELAAASAVATLAAAGRGPGDVDLVVYATNTFWDSASGDGSPARCLDHAGLTHTPLCGVALNGCGNGGLALRTARAWVGAGQARCVLVVTTDRCRPGRRLMPGRFSVLSDGAASCLVTAAPAGPGFRLLAAEAAVDATMHAIDPDADVLDMLKATAGGVRAAVERLRGHVADGTEFAHLVTNNYTTTASQIFCHCAGVPFERAFLDNLAAMGHCFGADVLIGLARLLESGRAGRGDRVLAIDSGHGFWGAAALEAT